MRLIYEKAAAPAAQEDFDTDVAWQAFRAKLNRAPASTAATPPVAFAFWLRVAAGVTLLVTAGVFGYRYFKTTEKVERTFATLEEMASDTLPDGTAVFLNRQSKIIYDGNAATRNHRVSLEGEAYFQIQHDDEKTFVVTAGEIFIRDIGTVFNVNAYPDSTTIDVAVEEGAVVMYNAAGDSLDVTAGHRGVYDRVTKTFLLASPRVNATAYKTKNFSFTDASLAVVVETLNRVYTEQFHIDENLKDCTLTVSFRNEDPSEIAAIIAETLGLTVSRNGNHIQLTGPGCGTIAS